MLSLKKLQTLNVTVADNAFPVTIDDEIELSDEDGYNDEPEFIMPERNETGIAMLLRMFKQHSEYLTPAVGLGDSYKECWISDMKELILANGLTTDEFELCLNQ